MSHKVSANYTLPTVLNTVKPAANSATAKPKAATTGTSGTGTSGTSSTSSSTGTDLGTTFLNLLATELQNQDPTAPVDSTAMVGQMISLNQLDQLISINQAVNPTSSSSSSSSAQAIGAAATAANTAGSAASALSPSAQVVAMQNQLPFDPNTMMPIGSGAGNANAVSASMNSPLNAAMSGATGSNSTTSGGK
jgi:flagellar basal-body rod modification protein FlgD